VGGPGPAAADFRSGLDLGTLPAFAAFGAAAPRLSLVAGDERPWKVDIGGVRYEVFRVLGGGVREDYLLRVGRSLYPAPFERAGGGWTRLGTATWYDGSNAPRFASAAAAAAGIDRGASFERRCAGCHQGGFQVSFDAPSGEWLTGYAELGVGCESCHGPGAEHALTADPSRILNPRDLDDGTPAGHARSDEVCAACHTRGAGAVLPGAPAPVEYPWSGVSGGFRPGLPLASFLAATTDPGDFWGYQDNYLGLVPTPADPSDDAAVAARSPWMQAQDHGAGVHAASVPGDTPRCIECHDPHARRQVSQIRVARDEAPGVRTSAEDGSLCLSCHAGDGPFADITLDDVADFTVGRRAAVRDSVVAHMKDSGMPVDPDAFAPKGTGVGRCTTCHMPRTGPGAAGGDHACLVLWPTVTEKHGMPNSCSGCHPSGGADPVGRILDQWRRDGADGDGLFHGNAPLPIHLGVLNAASGQGTRCVACHTTTGFREIRVGGDATGLSQDGPRLNALVQRGVRLEEGITCAACHGRDASNQFAPGANPLRVPALRLCGSCHFSAGITFLHFTTLGTEPHYPQQEMLDGTAGEEPPGSGSYTNSSHTPLPEGCLQCHYPSGDPAAKTHSFEPALSTCAVCHPGITTFDRVSYGDWDGDGTLEGLQSETDGLLAVLKTAILTGDAAVTFAGKSFFRNGLPGLPGASAARQRAAWNWEVVFRDGSRGIHNGARAVKLLQQSYRELTGVNVPGAAIR